MKILSTKQKEILEKSGHFVVKACPGSGKTLTVAACFSKLMQSWEYKRQGIAVISFTNVAWKEIKKKLRDKFNINSPVDYPHFIGTIDSFINNYVFLPFGHLEMKCKGRPDLVGEPHKNWNKKDYDHDYAQYFDVVSYGLNDKLLYPTIQGVFHFGYSKFFNQNGEESGHAANIREVKKKYWREGYANQRDANYFALEVLEKNKDIAKALVGRFPFLIVDEAQDTSEIQMSIIDNLIENGLKNVMLVGDPDQAIFEWNDAKPELFIKKFDEWNDNSIPLNENWRSSQNICNFTKNLSDAVSNAMDKDVKDLQIEPKILEWESPLVKNTVNDFLTFCKQSEINIEITPDNVAVLYRSDNFLKELENVSEYENNFNLSNVWVEDDYLSYDFVKGKYLIDCKQLKEGHKIISRALIKHHLNKSNPKKEELEKYIENKGFLNHRKEVFEIFSILPATNELSLDLWIEKANESFKNRGFDIQLKILGKYNKITFDQLFQAKKKLKDKPYYLGTVHSVKGETFEAVLLLLKKKGALPKYYKTLLQNNEKPSENEELRVVYVGITRPRKVVWLAVPKNCSSFWHEKLLVN